MGFAFDTYELLLLPLIARPALLELGGFRPGTPEFASWFSLLFYVPAVAGGIFGLLGGYLTDRFGRRRVLSGSIIIYALASFAAGYATTPLMLLILRCFVFIGVCVEFVAAVAWLAELFPEARQREAVIGATQAFSSLGGLMAALTNGIIAAWVMHQPAQLFFGFTLPPVALPVISLPDWLSFLGQIADPSAHWRYTLMSGLAPAILLLLLRLWLPESPQWMERRQAGTLRRPRISELFAPNLRKVTLVTSLMITFSFAAAFGAIQQIPQIVPGLPEVRAIVATALTNTPSASLSDERRIAGSIEQRYASSLTKFQEIGGLCGRIAFAAAAVIIVSRRRLLRLFLFPGLFISPLVFAWAGTTSLAGFEYGVFVAGFLIIAQFSFWGNYLPRVFPLHLRGTGESFSVNIGGRMVGTCFAAVTQWLAYWLPIQASYATRVAYVAAGVAALSFLVNCWASYWLPEPKNQALPE
jgi:MFS family permease